MKRIRNASEFLRGDVAEKLRLFATQLYEEHGTAEPFAFARAKRNPATLEEFSNEMVFVIRPEVPIRSEKDTERFIDVVRSMVDRANAQWAALVLPDAACVLSGAALSRTGSLRSIETVLVQLQKAGEPVRSQFAPVIRREDTGEAVVMPFSDVVTPWLRALVPSPEDKTHIGLS